MDPVAEFEALARDYCAFVERASEFGRDALLDGLEARIARLYASAIELPDVDLADYEDTQIEVSMDELRATLADVLSGADYFRVVFDPWSEDAAIVGSLSDCAGDIYRDLREGIGILDAGRRDEAIWSWRFLFNNHWGRHAVEALSAIYTLTRPR